VLTVPEDNDSESKSFPDCISTNETQTGTKILLVRHGHVEGMCCSDQLNPPRKAVVQRLSKLLRAAKIDTVACVYVRRAIDN